MGNTSAAEAWKNVQCHVNVYFGRELVWSVHAYMHQVSIIIVLFSSLFKKLHFYKIISDGAFHANNYKNTIMI